MTKIDVFSGFLGAGKTTLIKKLLKEGYNGEKLVLIENEFGEIGIDGGFMKEAGIEITEMNQGCICCSLVGDFGKALRQVIEQFQPDRILIEPSGVGKLSDVLRAVSDIEGIVLNSYTTVCDASKIKMYMKNYGEFYKNQVETAKAVILSRTQKLTEEKLAEAVALVREHNPNAKIVTTSWDEISGEQILAAMEGENKMADELLRETLEHHHEHEHHHHHEDGEECHCHEHEHDEHEHHHHHHEDGEECHCHEHEHDEHEHHHDHDEHEHHHHEDGEECHCHEHEHHHDHEHHHHHGHDADEVFTSIGVETAKMFTKEELESALGKLSGEEFGAVLRAKGIVRGDGVWYHFDFVPEEFEVRTGAADVTGKMCVIGAKLEEKKIKDLFGV